MTEDAHHETQRGSVTVQADRADGSEPHPRKIAALEPNTLRFLRSARHRAAHAQIGEVRFAPDDPARKVTASIFISYHFDDLLVKALEPFGFEPPSAGSLSSDVGAEDKEAAPQAGGRAPAVKLDADNIINLVCSLIVSDEALAPAVNDVEVLLTSVRGAGLPRSREVPLSNRAAALLETMRIAQDAREAILSEGVADAEQIGQWLGGSGGALRDKASKARRAGKLLGLDVNGRTKYPVFQIDPARARIRPGVSEANMQLNARDDPWGVASWWLSPSGWLPDGQRPADIAVAGEREVLQQLVDAVGKVD